MSPIKQIGNLPPEFRRTERNEKQTDLKRSADSDARAPTKADQGSQTIRDQVNVSESARTLLQRDQEIQQYANKIPNVETLSTEARDDIKARLDSGFYSSSEVTAQVAARIFETEAVGSTPQTDSTTADLTPTRMQEVLENIRTKQYDNEAILGTIADKLLKDL